MNLNAIHIAYQMVSTFLQCTFQSSPQQVRNDRNMLEDQKPGIATWLPEL